MPGMHGGLPPVLVVGGGVAGLCTALAAAPRPVLLVGRGRASEDSASVLAQGGIAAALGQGDSVAAHVEDTLVAGARHNDATRVGLLAGGAAEAVAWLEAQGVAFDRIGPALRLAREGGHRCARVVHAGGDASGARMVAALVEAARRAPHIRWRGGVDVHGLQLRAGRVVGACLRATDAEGDDDGAWIETAAVVLATGGIGALFARTTNPEGADGAGLALAMAAGAAVADLEFVQFHPTALDVPGHSLPLVTEALRGMGARLLDGAGEPLMAGRHPQGDLAARDVVARAACASLREHGGVRLDARGLDIDWARDFPTVLAHCLGHGLDPSTAPVPVVPAAHFHMGGVVTDALGRTSLAGLHAVGEVACSGVHGANRLASNSLLEGVVFGRRLGAELARACPPPLRAGAPRRVLRGRGLDEVALQRLRVLLSAAAGPVRTAAGLDAALEEAEGLAETGWQARLAVAVLRAASRRRGSLGAHWLEEPEITSPA